MDPIPEGQKENFLIEIYPFFKERHGMNSMKENIKERKLSI